ncbi:MAG: CDP-glucose 4,6-dehydratase [Nitrosotalea sp.]
MKISSSFERIFKGKIVFVTGHTGFIGSWLTLWLHSLGAKVVGYSLKPPTQPSMFEITDLKKDIIHIIGDIRNFKKLQETLVHHKPEFVFHLAAQPIVTTSYEKPIETLETNIMGTANLLESVRKVKAVKSCVVFTSDKCYANREISYAYSEDDPMGGHDPYSASKGATELVTASLRNSFFNNKQEQKVGIATARAGNVIAGGDWAMNRIVPDCIRALSSGKPMLIRNPSHTRPFQHVLEPVSGILCLAMKMRQKPEKYSQAWNFGPKITNLKTSVKDLAEEIINKWESGKWKHAPGNKSNSLHEASTLFLDSSKANKLLGWHPVYLLDEAVKETVSWYKAYFANEEMKKFTLKQIDNYEKKAKKLNIIWAN